MGLDGARRCAARPPRPRSARARLAEPARGLRSGSRRRRACRDRRTRSPAPLD
jgi:hypothetical protein